MHKYIFMSGSLSVPEIPRKFYQRKTPWVVLFSLLFLLVFAVSFLVTAPKVVDLVDSSLVMAQNEQWEQPNIIENKGEVAGIQAKAEVVITNKGLALPQIYSAGAVAIDVDSGEILFERNSTKRLSPASTTKIMTALVAKDHFKAGDVLTVRSDSLVGGSTMGLSAGEEMSFRSLLYGMMLNSGNDAAFTIAGNYPGGVSGFVAQMNAKVSEMGLMDTHFQNPAGFDNSNHYSSALDLAKIAREASMDPQISRIVSTKETSVMSWDKAHNHLLKNLNKLLGEEGIQGFKTGTTDLAGESLVTLVERDGHKVITVVLNSPDRFSETRLMIDWVYENYDWVVQ